MRVEAYLGRIGIQGNPQPNLEPSFETLRKLHLAHLYSVPFENLDIPLGQPLGLSLPVLFDKIVGRRRGGFCYELNGLFAWLLQELGFPVVRLAGRVFGEEGLGPPFDHMLLVVGEREKWIADVGFGDSFLEPLVWRRGEQVSQGHSFRLLEEQGIWTLQRLVSGAAWESQYLFSEEAHPLEAFEEMCHYQQTSPGSVFTRKATCSRATVGGRVTLANGRLILTEGSDRRTKRVESAEEYRALLRKHFAMALPREAPVENLLGPSPVSSSL
ncbi:MAG: arylamine N-acetyltransferase [Deltaproteobacteria bacterium]|nr:arylamine N-acetyltransferase [Deltaproteobacteria bacterium]